jgi:uncharacterized OB-fold protein
LRTPRFITAYRCPTGCLWLHEHEDCPDCGGRLEPVRINNEANVVSDTVVRVNPSGSPIHLGVARTTTGATTLCIIQGQIRGNGHDKVRLVVRDGRFHALTGRPRQRANRGDYKRS